MKLKTFAIVSALALTCTGIVAGAALVVVTDYLEYAASGIRESVESIYAAEELQLNLLLHNRATLLEGLTSHRAYVRQVSRTRRRIDRLLDTVREHVSTDHEEHVRQEVEDSVRHYFDTRHRALSTESSTIAAYIAISTALESANGALEALIDVNRGQANSLTAAVVKHDRLADRLGRTVVVVILVVVASILLLGWHLLYLPMLALSRAIRTCRYQQADSRVTSTGMQEMRAISLAFNDMADRLKRDNDNQLRFLASIAHDLRNPLGAIRVSSDLLRPGSGISDAKRAKISETVQRQVAHLERLITDLMDTARVEAGELDISPHYNDARLLVEEVATLFHAFSDNHRVEVHVPDIALWCEYDAQRMGQVLNNLVSNAIKYSPLGGAVRISAAQKDGHAMISVSDDGMGVAEHEKETIFEPFRRSATTRDTIPGVGLGLSVSRKIIERHGGYMEVDSRIGHGATFRVFMPLNGGMENRRAPAS